MVCNLNKQNKGIVMGKLILNSRSMGTSENIPKPSHNQRGHDPRQLDNGYRIPTDSGYADEPFVAVANDGAWVCVPTTNSSHEGSPGQYVGALRSTDHGRTWSEPVPLETPGGPVASHAVILKAPSGRLFVFYNHNTDNLDRIRADNPPFTDNPPYEAGWCYRLDSLGHYVFKYSDDNGRSWSTRRYPIPQRLMAIDRGNNEQGRVLFFWNVGRPFILDGAVYVPLGKVGGFGEGFFTSSEGVLLTSKDLLSLQDPSDATWTTLPDSDHGIRAPEGGGPIAGEHSYSILSDGSLFCVFRTIDGHPGCAYSRDHGHTWSPSQYMCYGDGRPIKHPRAANFAWRCSNGKYLYWFHNHGGRILREHPDRRGYSYSHRNPVWILGGEEIDGREGKEIRWSQPEILLYDDDPMRRISYPDLIEDDGRYFVTETQKTVARVHEIPKRILEAVWSQGARASVTREELLLECGAGGTAAPRLSSFVTLDGHSDRMCSFHERTGITMDCWLQTGGDFAEGTVLLDNRTPEGKGIALLAISAGRVELILHDGRTENRWASDCGCLRPGVPHHLAVIVDAGPKIISFVIDGRFNDGGDERQFGFGRFSPDLSDINGASHFRVHDDVQILRVYARALLVSEVIGNYRAGERISGR
jgi:hypothetical protein